MYTEVKLLYKIEMFHKRKHEEREIILKIHDENNTKIG